MLLHWVFLLTCAHHILCVRDYNQKLPGKAVVDTHLNLMKTIYKPTKARSQINAGSPLLLTPLIEKNKLKEARKAAIVDLQEIQGVESYAGYLTVNKEYNANLWFWYFPVMSQSVETMPWITWLQGGPGASSLYGLFTEIGPFTVAGENKLSEIKFSWRKKHSLLFIDNPVGTGFSFTDDDRGYATNQTTIGENLYTALQQFLTVFPELRRAPLTIAGESYAGKHIPSLGIQIHWNRSKNQPINLYGLAIGNGFIDPISLLRYSYFVRETGLVDDNVADVIKRWEEETVEEINNKYMSSAFIDFNSLLNMLMEDSYLPSIYNYLAEYSGLEQDYLTYLESDSFRRAVHVGSTRFAPIGGKVYSELVLDFMNSAKSWLEVLLNNYKVMLYNGHLDIIVAYHPSVNTYKSLNFSGSEEYQWADRKPWFHAKRLAGYYKVADNLTEVMVRGAGHMVPKDQPAAALGLITAFTRGLSLDVDTEHLV